MNKSQNTSHVICVLDASGSMGSYQQDVRDGMNALIDDQKSERGDMTLSIVVYSDYVETPVIKKNIQDAVKLTAGEYRCGGLTAMYDGIKKAIEIDDTACIIVQTDGMENCSRTPDSIISKMISDASKRGAEFHLFGAGYNVSGSAKRIGIHNHITLPKTKKAMETSYSMMSDIASEYRFKKDNVKLV